MHLFKYHVLFLLVGLLHTSPSLAASPDYRSTPTEALVDALTSIDAPAPGLVGTATYEAFIAIEQAPRFSGGILGTPQPAVPLQMRELGRRGVSALPTLPAHLNDARPTGLVVGGEFFMFQVFAGEYSPRTPPCGRCRREELREWSDFAGSYTVKVADICFVLVGQIVNRNLVAVRYQPTGGLVVNSPIETPALALRTRLEWDGLGAEAHEQSLLSDIDGGARPIFFNPALARLRCYYPASYASLQGEAAEKRKRFEALENGGQR
jgi:hypothetical protein